MTRINETKSQNIAGVFQENRAKAPRFAQAGKVPQTQFNCSQSSGYLTQEHVRQVEASDVAAFRNHLLVINDKSNDLYVFDKDFRFVGKVDGTLFGPDIKKFEDIAVDLVRNELYLIGDFKNKQNGDAVEDHSVLFRFSLSEGTEPRSWKIENLTQVTLDLPADLGWSPNPEINELKVEGLAVRDGLIYLGVRRSALSDRSVQIFRGKDKLKKQSTSISLVPLSMSFQTHIFPTQPERPLQLSSLELSPDGRNLLVLLSAYSLSKLPEPNTSRDERFLGNQVLTLPLDSQGNIPNGTNPKAITDIFFQGHKLEGIGLLSQPLGPSLFGAWLVGDQEATLKAKGFSSSFIECQLYLPELFKF